MDNILNDIDDFEVTPEGESFADLLDAYSSNVTENVKSGDQIKGKIIHIGMDSIFINTGTKIDGVVEKKELLDENGQCPFVVGDTLELYVISSTESEIILSKSISGKADIGILMNAFESKMPVDGKVNEVCKGGFRVDILGKQAFCPVSQMDVKYIENQEEYIGKTFQFLIKRVEGDGKNIVISRRDYQNIDIEKVKKEFLETISTGAVVKGTITRIMPYGAFVELVPGLEGMVHISEISWSRLDKPEEVVDTGDTVNVKILSIEEGEKQGRYKISLSIKQAGSDPWELVTEKFHVGDTITGKVRRLVKFGAFVEISTGIEGLVHISEMSYTKRVQRPEDVVSEGESIEVIIKEINPDTKRISLSIRDATGDPWENVGENVGENSENDLGGNLKNNFSVGQLVEGELMKKESFGFFIQLAPGITALLPKSKINRSENASYFETIKIGATLKLIIEEINKDERKITLTTPDSNDAGEWQNYSPKNNNSMGSLGELLKQALDTKS